MDYIPAPFATLTCLLALVLALGLVLAFAMPTRAGRQSLRPPSLDSSPITMLPTEIIQHIASLLSSVAAASFASTCVYIRVATGTQYVSAIRASPTETLALLELLLADAPIDPVANLPFRLLCVHCTRLVPIYIGCGVSASPACKEAWELSKKHIESSFSPLLFHTLMAMDRLKRPCDALLTQITPSTSTHYDSHTGIAWQHSLRYHIAMSGCLLQRTVETYIFSHAHLDCRALGPFCNHLDGTCNNFSHAVEQVHTEVLGGSGRSQTIFIACGYCRTTVLVGARKFRRRGIGLFVIWWKDLGYGITWYEIWARQVGKVFPTESGRIGYFHMPVVEEFEGHNARYMDFDELSSRADRKELLRLSPYTAAVGK
ncbi:hypothetical protein VE02_09643 [Pseudogymnoascus sp. 03VT05]|nr:hypothetical protein VE02_09643 [Pseudogymnoascus sp. 03VT05]